MKSRIRNNPIRNLICAACIILVLYLIARSLNLVEFMENKDDKSPKEMTLEQIIKSPKALMEHKLDLIGLATSKGVNFEKLDKVMESNDKKALKKLFS